MMSNFRNRFTLSASALGLALVLVHGAAAQTAPAAPAPDSASAATPDIVVTGSLIRRANNTAVSPIVTVSQEALQQSGQPSIEDALNQLPDFTASGNSATGGQGTGGRATISLHGLGPNRNLVLLDGMRLPISDISGDVDTNIIPEAIIGGVDVITGGASAVYGSDAMSGVVNFKTVKRLDGVVIDLQDAVGQHGDANKFNGSISFGTHFAEDRGHIIGSVSFLDQPALAFNSRSFFHNAVPSGYIGTGTFVASATNPPSAATVQNIFAGYGTPLTYSIGKNLGFNNDGTLFSQTGAVNYKGPNGTNDYAVIGGNVRMPVGQQGDVLNGTRRKSAFLKGDYEITPSLTAYAQFMYVNLTVTTSSGGSLTQFPTLTTIPVTNPFIPTDLATVLASRANPTAPFAWNARYVGVPWKNWDENYEVEQYVGGLKGDITKGWSFDVFASYDQSIHTSSMHNAVLKSQVQQLLNAPDGGNSLCAGGFNPFGMNNAMSLSQACANFMTTTAISQERTGQTQVQGQVNGKLFDLGAGPAQIAIVADYRKNSYLYNPDNNLTANSGFAPGGNVEAFTATLPVPYHDITVKEVAGQVDIPLIADKPFIKELGIGAAARVSDYSVSGTVESYEADARWRPVANLLLRGSYQRAVRAPNIGELYSPPSGTQLAIGTPPGALGDPCDIRSSARTGANGAQVAGLCQAQGVPAAALSTYQFPTTATGQTVSGSTSLTPEKADTYNLGFVFNSPMKAGLLADFSLSVDYYNIRIKNVISTVPGLTVLSKCYNLDGSNPNFSPNNPFCQLISRDPGTGQLLTVATPYLNLGGVKTDGVEFQVHWSAPVQPLGSTGRFFFDSTVDWLDKYEVQLLPGAAFLNYTGISNGTATPNSVPPRATPVWKALTTFGYRSDTATLGLRWHYQAGMNDVSAVTTPNNVSVGVAAYATWDMFASYNVNKAFELRAGITNLFDRSIPYVASSQFGTDPALYDVIGRAFYLGGKLKF
ncbi:MAG: TonB-dependent receptor [Sphingomonadales bacterium]|nr:TonB-dependent receptor [Sphingomonadales bacterium]